MQILKYTKVLFISWDGSEVTYLENLFAPIFFKLKERYGYEFHIIQFTSANKEKIKQRKEDLASKCIHYLGIPTSQRSALLGMLKAKFLDIYRVKKYSEKHGIEVIMPRAVNAYFIVKALFENQKFNFVWDADGFPLEERVDFAGLSKKSLRYIYFKNLENQASKQASSIICRTQKAKRLIAEKSVGKNQQAKIFVVPNGTHVSHPNQTFIKRAENLTLVYAGSLGPQYMMPDMLETFQIIKRAIPEASLRILTFQSAEAINYIKAFFPNLLTSVEVKTVLASVVNEELRRAHIGITFRTSSFSMQAVAPIKVTEYLSAGLSILYSPGIGDLDELLESQPFAYSLQPLEREKRKGSLLAWIHDQLNSDYSPLIQDFAENYFSLDHSAMVYHQAIKYGNS